MDEMVERVAHALRWESASRRRPGITQDEMVSLDRLAPGIGKMYRRQAHVAIEAHKAALAAAGYVIVPREPTEAMVDAGADLIWTRICNDQNGCNAHAILAWRAMIDAALGPAQGTRS